MRFPSRHPMCECPELTFSNGAEVSAANKACAERTNGLTHGIITLEDLRSVMEEIRNARADRGWK